MQNVRCGRPEIGTEKMDTLFRRRNGHHILCGIVRLRFGARRRRRNEPNDRVNETVRFNMQFKVVRRDVNNSISKQKRFV